MPCACCDGARRGAHDLDAAHGVAGALAGAEPTPDPRAEPTPDPRADGEPDSGAERGVIGAREGGSSPRLVLLAWRRTRFA